MGGNSITKGTVDDKKGQTKRIFQKVFVKNSKWNDKDELLDVVYWGRQVISLFLGIIWGLIPLKGLLAILVYVIVSTFSGHFYVTTYQVWSFLIISKFNEFLNKTFLKEDFSGRSGYWRLSSIKKFVLRFLDTENWVRIWQYFLLMLFFVVLDKFLF